MIKKLLISFVIIAAVSANAVFASKALLSDTATLAANTFSTGTADLLIGKGQSGTFQDSQTGFSATILPGQTKTNIFRLKNNSSDVDFSIAAQAASVSGNIRPEDLTVSFTPVDSSENPVANSSSHTLAEWENPTTIGNPTILAGKTQEYKMDVTLSPTVTTGGVSSQFDFIFTGTQVTP